MRTINAFILFTEREQAKKTVEELRQSVLIQNIYLLTPDENSTILEGCEKIIIDRLQSSETVRKIANKSTADYTLIYQKPSVLKPGYFALERMIRIAEDTQAGMVYADYYAIIDGDKKNNPVVDYQEGSLRDDFNFGSLLLYSSVALKEAAAKMNEHYQFAGLYDLRLKVSQHYPLVHINEYLYTEIEEDKRVSGEKIFDYVDPKNRQVQIEMEQACTQHLKEVGAYLAPQFEEIEFNKEQFEYEASVIIPVRNRVKTIKDAIISVLKQKVSFPFNLIVVDNHSTDGTTEAIDEFKNDGRLLHLIPERDDLGIGGCWNMGVHHPKCGKFAIQLDSDDIYSGKDTLQKIVDAFYEQQCAMVVGTYRMTNFDMEEIPPGIIDHREWTPDNGRNNALRINGLGAPRAFYTPVLRNIKVPNTSYGEDYALGLNISRRFQIGRIYDVLYLCRRWEDNSDASLDIVKMNAHNLYKDRIRTWELQARKKIGKE
ncbi:glycosyltransferase family A protein [Proteiniphilum sp.]|uniref:glycosyltransferase family 2 protein n=1 Tax=Proteiniphilum sp. TaxID=1926877 RepID=UPI002B213CB0|nr:glycosyltransferase family A protein [Proteiniphilum sp.]MEA4917434.1 glycosyltransferase family A protein [Proteiniphilum sp.]